MTIFQDAHCRICGDRKVKTIRQIYNPDEPEISNNYFEYTTDLFSHPEVKDQTPFLKIVDVFCPNCFILYKVE